MIQRGDPDEADLPARLRLNICVAMIRGGVDKRVWKGAQDDGRKELDGGRRTADAN